MIAIANSCCFGINFAIFSARGVHAFFALSAVLASEVGYIGRDVSQKRLVPIL